MTFPAGPTYPQPRENTLRKSRQGMLATESWRKALTKSSSLRTQVTILVQEVETKLCFYIFDCYWIYRLWVRHNCYLNRDCMLLHICARKILFPLVFRCVMRKEISNNVGYTSPCSHTADFCILYMGQSKTDISLNCFFLWWDMRTRDQ